MSEMKVIQGNKMIAEFMGSCGLEKQGVPNMGMVSHAKYHTSWDWLMPVVEKIEGMGYQSEIKYGFINGTDPEKYNYKMWIRSNEGYSLCAWEEGIESKIKTVWLCVIQFIQWYNTLTTPTEGDKK